MTFESREMIPADHPALSGHFPGNPVVPGVLVLERVVDAVGRWRGECRVNGIRSVRFAIPLAAGREFLVRLRAVEDTRVEFECLQDGRTLATGELIVSSPETEG